MAEMPLTMLRPISPSRLVFNHEAMKWLAHGMKDASHSMTIDQLLDQLDSGESILWAWDNGVLCTTFNNYPSGRELLIHTLAGKDFLERLPEVLKDLKIIARDYECRFLAFFTRREGLEHLINELEPTYKAAFIMKDLTQ